jgi:ABC-type multidrug transport system fused ATPase/permease subunit
VSMMHPYPGGGGRIRAMAAERPKPRPGSIAGMYRRMFLHVRSRWPLLAAAAVCMLAVAGLEFAIPQMTRFTIDTLIPARRYEALPWIAGGIIGTAVLLGLFQFLSGVSIASVGQHAIHDLRNELYRHIQKLDVGFFDRNRTGDLMSRVTSDVGMLQQLVSSGMMSIAADLITFVAVAAYMFWVDWQRTAIVMATFPFMLLATRVFGAKMRSAFRSVQESVAEVSSHLQDTLSSIRLIRAFAGPYRRIGHARRAARAGRKIQAAVRPAVSSAIKRKLTSGNRRVSLLRFYRPVPPSICRRSRTRRFRYSIRPASPTSFNVLRLIAAPKIMPAIGII